jgi:hypothetical protein
MGVDLDPLDPTTNFHLVKNRYCARQFGEAIKDGRNVVELTRDFPYTRWYIAWALVELGNGEEAWNTAVEARSLGGRQPLNEGHFGYGAAACGQIGQAREVIRDLEERGRRQHSPPWQSAGHISVWARRRLVSIG